MAERIRIQKAIAASGLMSRRKAEEAVEAGRVRLGDKVAILGDRVDVDSETLTLDGVPVPVDPDLETHLLYKPRGVISSASDTHGRKTVVDLIDSSARLYPVGRLDSDSEGLILVSNDGELTNRVTHPRYGITKKYVAKLDGTPAPGEIRAVTAGIELDDGPARALRAKVIESSGGEALVELVMVEGRNREVRRMMSAVGYEVVRLVRTAIGPISDRNLKPGESRRLTAVEIHDLLESGEET
jgi:23S rRNA pseudouridine2605 synthase